MKTNVVIHKISWLSFLVLSFLANPLFAQNRIGALVLVGSSNIDVNGLGILDLLDPHIKSIPQYNVGMVYERELSNQWSIVTGANYASRGFSMKEDVKVNLFGLDLPIGTSINTRLNYLEVPFTIKYDFLKRGATPYVKAGISTGYAINGKIQPTVNAIIDWKLPGIQINLDNDLYNRWDISALASAGISIATNSIGAVQLEVNYRHSLNDMFLDKITDIRIKSNGIGAGIGYTMRF